MASYNKFVQSTLLATVAKIIVTTKSIILLPFLTKTLGAFDYGIWTQIQVTMVLLTPLALLQLEYSMTRFLSIERDGKKVNIGISSIFSTILVTSILLSFFILLFADPIGRLLFGGPNSLLIQILAILMFFNTLDMLVIQYFISFREMKAYSILNILQTILELLLVIGAILFGYGIVGAIVSLIFVRIIIFSMGFFLAKMYLKITLPSFQVSKMYLYFSLPLIPFQISLWVLNLADRYLISYYFGAEQVGIYAAAYSIASLVELIFSPISLVFLPAITILWEREQLNDFDNHVRLTFRYFIMLAIPAVFGISVLSNQLLELFTTSEFAGYASIIPLVAVGVLLFRVSNLFSDLLILFKKPKLVSTIYIFSAFVNVLMNITLIPQFGILGAAVTTMITFFIHSTIVILLTSKYYQVEFPTTFMIKCVFSSTIMALVILLVHPYTILDVILIIIASLIIYFGVLMLLRSFSVEELSNFKIGINRMLAELLFRRSS